jgi:IPT/TIG domain-containing protein
VVTGTGFTGATDVTFNGVSASFTVDSDVQITTTVPAGATTGPVAVTTIDGTGTSANNFVVIVPPVINDFSPKSGTFRRVVTITGSGFTGTTSVRINGRPAYGAVFSDAQIRVRVPSGAGTGPIRVTNPAGFDLSNTVFRFLRFQHRIAVAMQLSGHLRALGRIIVPDGTRLCRARRTVLIQRFFSGRFRVVARGRSQLDGDYRVASVTRGVAIGPSWRRSSPPTTAACPT